VNHPSTLSKSSQLSAEQPLLPEKETGENPVAGHHPNLKTPVLLHYQ
jgi:hypothetical protein